MTSKGTWVVLSVMFLLPNQFTSVSGETGMLLVTQTTVFYPMRVGNIVRIDIDNDVVKTPTSSLGYGVTPRFSPDGQRICFFKDGGNTVSIIGVNGGEISSFQCDPVPNFYATLSWTNHGIWVGLDGKIVKYDTNGNKLDTYYTGANQRWGYVSRNEITGGGVYASGVWKPWVYQMRSGTNREASLNTDGCSVCPSPNGLRLTNNMLQGPDGIHRAMRILDTNGVQVGPVLLLKDITDFSGDQYHWDMQSWSGNSNEWILMPVGEGGSEPSTNCSPCIYNINTGQKFCGQDNSGTNLHMQPFDYYSGWVPGSAGPELQLSPSSLSFTADSGATDPPAQAVTATTATGMLEGLTAGGDGNWLNATPTATSGASITISNIVSVDGLLPGTYRDTVTVATTNAGTKDYVVTFTVNRPVVTAVLTTMRVTPRKYTVAAEGSVGFLATCRDQNGNYLTEASMSWSASGGGTIDQSGTYFAAATPSHGPHYAIAAATAGGVTLRDTVQVMVSRVAKASVHLRIDCGDDSYLPTGWTTDNAFATGGSDWNHSATVTTTGVPAAAPESVYQSSRSGNPHSYRITGVPIGDCTVRMHFADPDDTQRRMIYSILGIEVLRDFSISTLAGGADRALVLDFMAVVQDTQGIPILCSASSGNVFEAGIEVMQNRLSTVTLLSPHGGEESEIGQIMPIRFCTDTLSVRQLFIDLSVNNGRTWNLTTTGYGISMDDLGALWGTYNWVLPDSIELEGGGRLSTISDECRLRIRPYEASVDGDDASDNAFSIRPGGATVSSGKPADPGDRLHFTASPEGMTIHAASRGRYRVDVFTIAGRKMMSQSASGAGSFFVPILGSSVTIVRMKTEDKTLLERRVVRGVQ